ncbi:unnamed protein product [Psylliodes chrysocephalus]|uniref:Uncharacterized protein n=1 Tax=Psylliodes chrysocephalus TaxID=3402493 RepID=A0A9P0D428_9CUCU|nr:unnamed protein product [Psylliodes chrysocephala]
MPLGFVITIEMTMENAILKRQDFLKTLSGNAINIHVGFISSRSFLSNKLDSETDLREIPKDSIYIITRGYIKPRKHILLRITMKSLTGSKQVVEILSRQGYCITYPSILELETSAAYSCASNNQLCPSGILRTSLLSSGVAWDNYDRFVETSSESDVTNDQSEEEGDEDETDAVDEDDEDFSDESDED